MCARNPLTYWIHYVTFALGFFCVSLSFADFPDEFTIADLEKSVVQVKGSTGRSEWSGTGFITAYNPETKVATVFTNAHVIFGARTVTCCSWRNGKKVSCGIASVVKRSRAKDKTKDFAVLRVTIPATLEPTALKCSKNNSPVEGIVYGCGFPNGRGLVIYCGQVRSPVGSNLISFDTQISGGVSGGPLFNEKGEVCGVCSLLFQTGQKNSGAYRIADWL